MNISDNLRMILNECRQKTNQFEMELEILHEKQTEGKDKTCHFCGTKNFINSALCKECKRTF